MGIVQGFSGLVAARWFLGICESGTYSDYVSLDPRSTGRHNLKRSKSSLSVCASNGMPSETLNGGHTDVRS
jgi:hypothetical protein